MRGAGVSSTMLAALLFLAPLLVAGWGEKYEKARLRDVQVLTLREGAMTTGRRSSPVPQLSCVGGSGRGRGEPGVVQCYNRGWDGREVQWECKADMEGSVRFGNVEVVCEGYDYAEDDYILAGSCGLEYTLELTREGRQQDSYSGGGGWGGNYQKSTYGYGDQMNKWSGMGDLILLGVVGIIIYAFYKTCIDSNSLVDREYSSTDSDFPGGNPGGAGGWSNPNTGYGSAPGYGGAAGPGADCGGGARRRGTGAGGLGGFWTGAATGGLLGYMFGGRNNGYGGHTGYNRGYRTGYGGSGGWGGGGGWGSSGGGGMGTPAPSSSGTRTASGFGGTRRR